MTSSYRGVPFRTPKRRPMLIALAILAPALGARSFTPPDLPRPEHYVTDRANVIGAEHERALNGVLQELEQKTGVQYIILTLDSTGGLPIEQFSIELLDQWQLGQKGKDNGLLFTLALQDRAYHFEVGYGLEGVVPDQYAGQIGQDVLAPYLQRGDYSQGIYEANLRVIRRIADEYGVTLTGVPIPAARRPPSTPADGGALRPEPCCACPCCGFVLILLLLLLLLGGRGRRGGGWRWLLLLPLLFRGFGGYGGRGRGGAYGGGPFGGGFGGFGGGMGGGFGGGMGGGFGRFGGGGGGRFGGGGASGRW